jgi:hypothetical protein
VSPAALIPHRPTTRGPLIRHYLISMAIGNLLWEFLQQPFYTLWQVASPTYLVFAIIHCWIGDLMITAACLFFGMLIAGKGWPTLRFVPGATAIVLAGLSYTIFSEWRNVSVNHAWTYSVYMPRLPLIGTGLLPLLQWLLVPAVSLFLAYRIKPVMASQT